LDHLVAEEIIEHLRQGTVSIEHVEEFSVGRSDELAQAIHRMDQAERGDSQLSFVNGPYGAGKTHFLSMVRTEALRRNFAVTHVVLSGQSCPLDRLQTVFTALMAGLSTPECRDRSAFRRALDKWLNTIEQELLDSGMAEQHCRHGLAYSACGHGCFVELLANRVSALAGLHPDFALVLTAYFNANWAGDGSIMRLCEHWLLGHAIPAVERKRIGRAAHQDRYPKNISNHSALHAFGDAARIVRTIDCRGLIIMLDEAETMPSVGRGGEISAFVNLVLLMHACLHKWQGIYCVYATTPYFEYTFKRIFKRVCASAKSVDSAAWIEREFLDNRIDLGLPDREVLTKLAASVYRIYQAAAEGRSASAVPERAWVLGKAKAIVDTLDTNATIRGFVTRLVREIDRLPHRGT